MGSTLNHPPTTLGCCVTGLDVHRSSVSLQLQNVIQDCAQGWHTPKIVVRCPACRCLVSFVPPNFTSKKNVARGGDHELTLEP